MSFTFFSPGTTLGYFIIHLLSGNCCTKRLAYLLTISSQSFQLIIRSQLMPSSSGSTFNSTPDDLLYLSPSSIISSRVLVFLFFCVISLLVTAVLLAVLLNWTSCVIFRTCNPTKTSFLHDKTYILKLNSCHLHHTSHQVRSLGSLRSIVHPLQVTVWQGVCLRTRLLLQTVKMLSPLTASISQGSASRIRTCLAVDRVIIVVQFALLSADFYRPSADFSARRY